LNKIFTVVQKIDKLAKKFNLVLAKYYTYTQKIHIRIEAGASSIFYNQKIK